MGYNTWIEGEFTITPRLIPAHSAYLTAFADTRRMRRDPAKAATIPDPIRLAIGLPLGDDACFFVGGTGGKYREENDQAVIDGNRPLQGNLDYGVAGLQVTTSNTSYRTKTITGTILSGSNTFLLCSSARGVTHLTERYGGMAMIPSTTG